MQNLDEGDRASALNRLARASRPNTTTLARDDAVGTRFFRKAISTGVRRNAKFTHSIASKQGSMACRRDRRSHKRSSGYAGLVTTLAPASPRSATDNYKKRKLEASV